MTSYVLKRKGYWKYQYRDWTQPILTSDGVMGGDTFAASQTGFSDAGMEAYRAFDNDTSTVCYFAKSSGYFQWYNSNPLKITNLKLTNFVGDAWGTRALTSGSIQVSNDGSSFVELKTFTNNATGGGASWDIDLSSNTGYYKYYRIVCTGTSYANSGAANQCHIAEVKITATERLTVKGSATDYDFRTSKAYVLKRKGITEYRKTVIDTATAGTYTFDVAKERTAKIILVGGGGGGGAIWSGHAAGSGGGSGACVYIKAKLTAGTYTITNGAAGLYASGVGGNSTLVKDGVTLITASGGAGGGGGGNPPGNGGTYTISDSIEILEEIIVSDGNRGTQGTLYTGGVGGASLYKDYGRGGNNSANGVAGYIFVELETDKDDYTYKINTDKCYVLKRKRYWKYDYKAWTQPVLTANGTLGGSSFAVSSSSNYSGWPAWEAFDGILTGYNGWSASSNSYPQHLIFYNPVQLWVKKLTVINNYEGNVAFTTGNVYGSNDGSSWTLITSYTNANTTSGASWDIVLESNKNLYKYHKLEVTAGNFISTNLIKCTEVLITAQTFEGFIKGTKDDYDFID